MSTQSKRFVYAVVGLRPSERQEIERLLVTACQDLAQLRQASAGEHADFWVVNGDDPHSIRRLQADGVSHVLAVGGDEDQLLRVRRPFDPEQAKPVLARLLRELPERIRHEDRATVLESAYAETDPWAMPDTSTHSEIDSDHELTPSELAMTEDDPSELRMARRAAHEQRGSSYTLGPTGILDVASQEWLDVWPAQILVVADAEHRTRTLPKGLRKMGFGVDVMENVQSAQQAVARGEYRMVFLDQGALGAGLVAWCKAFLQTPNVQGLQPGVVVIARRKAPLARWRAKRVGCAAWMEVPLDRQRLLTFLVERGVERSQPREL